MFKLLKNAFFTSKPFIWPINNFNKNISTYSDIEELIGINSKCSTIKYLPDIKLFHITTLKNSKFNYGFINELGEIVLEYKYDSISTNYEDLIIVRKDNKFHILNLELKKIIDCKFDNILGVNYYFDEVSPLVNKFYEYTDNIKKEFLIPVCLGEKWGYINNYGKFVIEPQYRNVGFFHNGYAPVEKNNTSGFIDINNNFFDKGNGYFVHPNFCYKYLAISGDVNTYYLSSDGYRFDISSDFIASNFINNYSIVMKSDNKYDINPKYQLGIINREGGIHIDFIFNSLNLIDSKNGIAIFSSLNNPNKYGIINIFDKHFIIQNIYDSIFNNFDSPLYSRLCFNYNYNEKYGIVVEKDGKYGIIDLNNKFLIDPIYERIIIGKDNLFILVKDDSYYYLDLNRNYVKKVMIPFKSYPISEDFRYWIINEWNTKIMAKVNFPKIKIDLNKYDKKNN